MYQDTIAAIATPVGEGGIGIVRLSGPEANDVASALFRRGRGFRSVAVAGLQSHQLYYGAIVDPASGRQVDEVMLVRMAAPRTYTREDVVEISCHGGLTPVREVLSLCLAQGARPAEAGEFTLRAFMNGRIDLSQAEAVSGVVSARTVQSLDLAVGELRGRLSQRLSPARDSLVETLAYLDAAADFPDDEIPPFDLEPALEEARAALEVVVASAKTGLLYREGIQVAIVGRPNVGKSSLLNTLLRSERAIVTEVAGTTRDVIAESINLRGIPATLLDTAGITETEDIVEKIGVHRSQRALATSGLALFVLDRSEPATSEDLVVADLLGERLEDGEVLVALNKSDLPASPSIDLALKRLPGVPVVEISTLSGAGIDELESALYELVVGRSELTAEPALVTVRQLDALRRALDGVVAAQSGLVLEVPLDLLAVDVRTALYAVGEITGERVSEAVLDEIFSRFCIGK
ncbi:MAG: tRNA uridine-5-carboxymethylaminomethyl(34) synthesis GTPase MnmE [Chloroflexia bacterium]|nr:tRNA uridine-5-carboxymethylaminomethyl(34) synthesis GTPase MnmE [Chloroflexia bacterium]